MTVMVEDPVRIRVPGAVAARLAEACALAVDGHLPRRTPRAVHRWLRKRARRVSQLTL